MSGQRERRRGIHSQSGEVGGTAAAGRSAGAQLAALRRQGLLFVQPQRPQRRPLQQQKLQFERIHPAHSR